MTPNLSIDPEIKSFLPNIRLGVIQGKVNIEQSPSALLEQVHDLTSRISNETQLDEIHSIDAIKSSRNAYKLLGKEPSRYRPSAEALYRRIIQGKGMYFINCVVDIINLISMQTGFSIGGYDASKIKGKIMLKRGLPDVRYDTIGRGNLNIENLPVLNDSIGPFGTPTSDSERTKILESTNEIILAIFDFESSPLLTEAKDLFVELLAIYADAGELNTTIID